MKILACHNFYQQSGGEDQVFLNEVKVLKDAGHEVVVYTRDNHDIRVSGVFSAALDIFWSRRTYQEVHALIQQCRPDIVHVYNFFPLISPSVFDAARAAGVPVVWGLNNQRLMCPGSNFTLKGELCTMCLGKVVAWPGILNHCYRKSFFYTCAVALLSAGHCWAGTWKNKVDGYMASTEFYKELFIRQGLPVDKIFVKPHMVAQDQGMGDGDGAYALFIGRLDPEKGAMTLIHAWKELKARGVSCPLKVRGDGQLREAMQAVIDENGLTDVSFIDRISRNELFQLMRQARFLVWPSHGYYETFGLVAFESYACGRPVVASRIGVLAEHVQDGITGLHFMPADPVDLACKAAWAWAHPREMHVMGRQGRALYERKYTAAAVCQQLLDVYQTVIDRSGRSRLRGL